MDDTLYTLTLHSGHVRESLRHEVAESVCEMQKLIRGGTLVQGPHTQTTWVRFGFPSPDGTPCTAHLSVAAAECIAVICIEIGGRPAVDMSLCWMHSGENWAALAESSQRRGLPVPEAPTHTPWLAVRIVPGQDNPSWLGETERCLAWAILGMPEIVGAVNEGDVNARDLARGWGRGQKMTAIRKRP